jgi:hypothetical protein
MLEQVRDLRVDLERILLVQQARVEALLVGYASTVLQPDTARTGDRELHVAGGSNQAPHTRNSLPKRHWFRHSTDGSSDFLPS